MSRPVCSQCQRPIPVCYCHTILSINNQWPITILQHATETKHAIGTARIAQLSLQQCQLTVVNDHVPIQLEASLLEAQPLLVYPGENNLTLEELDTNTVRPLLFLDATWRKARRLYLQSPELQHLPTLALQPRKASRYRIRKEPKPEAMSTIEAVATVLAALESNPRKYQPLLDTMDWMIEQQITAMGASTFKKNYS